MMVRPVEVHSAHDGFSTEAKDAIHKKGNFLLFINAPAFDGCFNISNSIFCTRIKNATVVDVAAFPRPWYDVELFGCADFFVCICETEYLFLMGTKLYF